MRTPYIRNEIHTLGGCFTVDTLEDTSSSFSLWKNLRMTEVPRPVEHKSCRAPNRDTCARVSRIKMEAKIINLASDHDRRQTHHAPVGEKAEATHKIA